MRTGGGREEGDGSAGVGGSGEEWTGLVYGVPGYGRYYALDCHDYWTGERDEEGEALGTYNVKAGTPYENGLFTIDIIFPPEYPFKAPKVRSYKRS